jgi:hypothetical protein
MTKITDITEEQFMDALDSGVPSTFSFDDLDDAMNQYDYDSQEPSASDWEHILSDTTDTTPARLVDTVTIQNHLAGYTEEECDEVELAFNAWCVDVATTEAATQLFIEFVETVHNHTYCDVCATTYHDDEPCEFH